MRFIGLGLALALAAGGLLAAQSGYKLFQQGLAKERAEADLRGAIGIYEQVIQASDADRKLAAQALYRIGECHRELGEAAARQAYERIVKEYREQRKVVAQAQARLAAMLPRTAPGPVARLVKSMDGLDPRGLSPDGSAVAFANMEQVTDPATSRSVQGGLAIRDLQTGETRQLTWEQDGWRRVVQEARISADGRLVAYAELRDGERLLRIVPVDGSATPRTLYRTDGEYFRVDEWFPDGSQILISRTVGEGTWALVSVSIEDGSSRQLQSFRWQIPRQTSISPDGRYIAYDLFASDPTEAGVSDIFVLSSDLRQHTALVQHPATDCRPQWSPDGSSLLFVSERTAVPSLWSIPVKEGRPAGRATLVKGDLGPVFRTRITRDGTLYYTILGRDLRNIQTVALRDDGHVAEPPELVTDSYFNANWGADLSPKGDRLAYYSNRPRQALVVRELATGRERSFPVNVGPLNGIYNEGPHWFPDGRAVLITIIGQASAHYRVDVDKGAMAEIEAPVHNWGMILSIAPDGGAFFYRPKSGPAVARFDLPARQETILATASSGHFSDLAISPDGELLAYALNDPERGSFLYVVPARGGEPREVHRESHRRSASRYNTMTWTPDGRFLLRADESGQSVLRYPLDGGEPQDLGLKIEGSIKGLRVHPEGSRLFFSTTGEGSEVWALENFLPEQTRSR